MDERVDKNKLFEFEEEKLLYRDNHVDSFLCLQVVRDFSGGACQTMLNGRVIPTCLLKEILGQMSSYCLKRSQIIVQSTFK